MELKDYWEIIRHRWGLILGCLVLAVGAAGVLTWQTTPLYESSTRLFVSTSESDVSQAYQGGLFATQRVASYSELVKGNELADRVADRLGGETTADDLQSQVRAEVVPETVILQITATNPDPELARDIAQAYAAELELFVSEIETTGSKPASIKATEVGSAQVSDAPVTPNIPRNIGLAAVLGLLLGIGLAVLRELLDTSISSAADVTHSTEAPILGNIHQDPGSVKIAPVDALSNASPWSEAYRVLRTNMQYVEVDHDHRIFVVSSSLPGEGKSTTASNLALTLAMADQRVALIECDLRRPTLARRLELDDAVGATSVLIGRVSLQDAMQVHRTSGLHVLTSGPIPPNPAELLQSVAMEKLLTDLRHDYDVVIIDAPPLLPVTDAALLATQADGCVVVVRHGKTTRDQLTHSIERLEAVDAKPVGVVINATPAKRAARAYSYSYGYGYGYAPVTATETKKKDSQHKGRRRRG
ncbi:polysaccharide biosynthesis tyrosine autokinase [Nocardioides aestuarii]|uniref:non-specific protein-tyrosine kinase n=1 Tax=Nocardioides aestuarii TaxID=252231 RepID=A0ABW4TLN9_9ACTN